MVAVTGSPRNVTGSPAASSAARFGYTSAEDSAAATNTLVWNVRAAEIAIITGRKKKNASPSANSSW
ncbi:hypothetical protein EBM89_16355 [Cellulomonas triticagri]|uniref:Uncharacterized protein n=1 Tax=Cellulomonas triticagri TaxID=2483352 RepID=A0A3M2IT81_9CELL|nr:hypothetical protein EBM89_16355 [Cellulomonas triticagri]